MVLLKCPSVEVWNQNSSQLIFRFYHKCELFTLTFCPRWEGVIEDGGWVGLGIDGSMMSQLDSRSTDPQWSPS